MGSRSSNVAAVLHVRPSASFQGQPARDPGDLPDPEDVERWLSVARARLEQVLADYDADLVQGVDASASAERGLRRYMAWCRRSVVGLVTVRGALQVSDDLRTRERMHWDRTASTAAVEADRDPNGMERFLRLWLTVVHDAVSTGYASMHGDPTAW